MANGHAAATIFTGGVIWTGTENAEALLVIDGTVRAIGDQAHALASTMPAVESVDLGGGFLMPSFGDGHAHPLYGGLEAAGPPIRGCGSVDEIVLAVKQFAAENPDQDWIIGASYDGSLAPDGLFDSRWLDAAVPDRPVALRAWDYHTMWCNSVAIERAGITADTPDPVLGEIPHRADGSVLGTLREWGATDLVSAVMPTHDQKTRVAALGTAADYFLARGVFADGVIENETGALLAPYCSGLHSHGMRTWEGDSLAKAARRVDELGLQIHIHAIGDAAIRQALDAIEYTVKHNPDRDRRPVIAHVQLADDADLGRFAELGVIPNMQPLWAQMDSLMTVLTVPRLGVERSDKQYRMRSLTTSGAPRALGSDWPVSSGAPLDGIAVAGSRRTASGDPEGGWTPHEILPIEDTLAAYTAGVAYQAFAEGSWGRIISGASADLVWLDRDPRTTPVLEIPAVTVRATYLRGRPVYTGTN